VKIIKKKNCNNKYYESKILRLNSYKAKKFLRWEPQYNLETSINQAALWYKKFMVDKKILNFSKQQIFKYLSRLK
jgi:nucleoside-diphosphate-sugar epimerase